MLKSEKCQIMKLAFFVEKFTAPLFAGLIFWKLEVRN